MWYHWQDLATDQKCTLKILKSCFDTKAGKDLLRHGAVVLEFSMGNLDDTTAMDADDDLEGYYFHVGYMSWSPYRPILQRLTLVAAPAMIHIPNVKW
eukprot:6457702-Amphidinium_carterae.1